MIGKRKLGIVLAVVAAIAGLLLVALVFATDVDRYRGWIEERAEQATGRDVRLGTMRLSLFPLGVRVAGVTVAALPAEGGGDLLAIEHVQVEARLGPLLSKRLEVTGITIDQPSMTLERGRDGSWNVERLLAPKDGAAAGEPAAQGGTSVLVRSLRVTGGRITVRDLSGEKPLEFALTDLDLALDEVALDRAVQIALQAGLECGGDRGRVTARGSAGPLGAAPVPVDLALSLDHLPHALLGRLTSSLGIDTEVRSASLTTTVSGQLPDAFDAKGSLSLDGPRIHEVRYDVAVRQAGAALDLRQVDLAFAKSEVKVRGKVRTEREARVLDLALGPAQVPSEDLTALLTWALGELPVSFTSAAPVEIALTVKGAVPALAVGGTLLSAGGAVDTLDFRDLAATIRYDGGIVTLQPFAMTLYGGSFGGAVTGDLRETVPRFTVRGDVKDVDLDAFLADNLDSPGLLAGRFTGRVDAAGNGVAYEEIVRSLEGQGEIAIADGHVGRLDVLSQLSKVSGLLGEKTMQSLSSRLAKDGTAFSRLGAKLKLGGGTLRLRQLALEAPDFRIDGEADVDLLAARLEGDFRLVLSEAVSQSMHGEKSNAGELFWNAKTRRVELPFSLAGPFAEPKASVDFGAVGRNAAKGRLDEALRGLAGDREAPKVIAVASASADATAEITRASWGGSLLARDLTIEGAVATAGVKKARLVVSDAAGAEVHGDRIGEVDRELAAAEPKARVSFRVKIDGKKLVASKMPLAVRLIVSRGDGTSAEAKVEVDR